MRDPDEIQQQEKSAHNKLFLVLLFNDNDDRHTNA